MNEQEIMEFWRNLCSEIVSRYPESGNWKPWLEKTFVDGTPMNDCNPNYDLINNIHKRAVRIIQEDGQISSSHNYSVWLNKFGEGLAESNEVIEELVFTYRSHQDSSQIFSELFNVWANPKVTYEEMQQIISSNVTDLSV
jgi:hypothetical protein